MTEQELQAIEARAEAATTGPWEIDREELDEDFSDEEQAIAFPESIGPIVAWEHERGGMGEGDIEQVEADAAFIAHARDDVPALIAAVREERTRADRAEADAKHWRLVAETMAGKP